jgi:succinoglycan biosynthesis transport protein ExoP
MSFEQLIAVLRARWMIALGVFVLVAGAVTTYTLLMPKSYTASGSVVLDIRSPDPIAGMVLAGVTQPSFLMTQIDIMTSTRVAQKVVRNLKLSDSTDMRERWRTGTGGMGDYEMWVGDLLRKSLEARPSRGSNVINISYSAADPQFAAAVVNAFIQGYLETDRDMRNSPAKQFRDQFDGTAKQMRASFEEAQLRLSSFHQENGLIVTDERLDVETSRLNQLSSELVGAQSAMADTISRQAAAQNRVNQSPDVMGNPLLTSLRGDLIRQEGQLEQLSARLGEQHPQVIELQSTIKDLRNKIETETRRIAGSVGVSNSVNSSRVAQIRASLEEQRGKVLKMKNIRDQAAVLQRDVDNAQRALDGVTARLQNTNLESQAKLSNVAILESAGAPSYPSSPHVVSNIALGTLAAAVLGIGLALIAEARDRRLRTHGEVEAWLNQPLLGAVPSFKKQAKRADPPLFLSERKPAVKALAHSA